VHQERPAILPRLRSWMEMWRRNLRN
jgi:hypothetical protein